MRCEKCGLDVADKSSFCSHCGAAVSEQGRMQQMATTNEPTPQPMRLTPRAPLEPQAEKVLWQEYPSFRTAFPILAVVALVAIIGWILLLTVPALREAGRGWTFPWLIVSFALLAVIAMYYFIRLRSTRYRLTSQRIFIEHGLLNKRTDEVELEKYKDVFVNQDFWDRIVGCGDIRVITGDVTNQTVEIIDVIDPLTKKELIRSAARDRQSALGIIRREDL
jgi:uncharacterized membrane protein YdbT with pleckstrin-like domain